MPETTITQGILNWLNGLPDARAIKIHGGAMQGKGRPDVTGCIQGRCLWLEVKRPGEHPSEIQRWELDQWHRAGAITGVVRCVADVRALLAAGGILVDEEARRDHLRARSLAYAAERFSPDDYGLEGHDDDN